MFWDVSCPASGYGNVAILATVDSGFDTKTATMVVAIDAVEAPSIPSES
jgi:hypothetical protein